MFGSILELENAKTVQQFRDMEIPINLGLDIEFMTIKLTGFLDLT